MFGQSIQSIFPGHGLSESGHLKFADSGRVLKFEIRLSDMSVHPALRRFRIFALLVLFRIDRWLRGRAWSWCCVGGRDCSRLRWKHRSGAWLAGSFAGDGQLQARRRRRRGSCHSCAGRGRQALAVRALTSSALWGVCSRS